MKVQVEDQSESCGSLRLPLPTQSHATRLSTRPTLPSVLPDQKRVCGISEKKSISTLKTFWKVAYESSIPNQYEPARDLPFKLSLRIDSLPTERKMLASIPSLRAMNLDCLAVRNPWGVKG